MSCWLSVFLLPAPLMASTGDADAIAAVQLLRLGGCGGTVPAAQAVHHDAALDRAAAQWANGYTLAAAAHDTLYASAAVSAVHVKGPETSLVQQLRRAGCRTITDRSLLELGVYRRGPDTWLLLASRNAVSTQRPGGTTAQPLPAPMQSSALAARALLLVNDVRSRGARCGGHSFGSAPPVKLSGTLNGVALGHAADMARHDYFEHDDLSGHTPADRVRAAGYPEKLVGENIAYGPESADEVVKGWLDSPGHCENIMDPRFAEMGIAYSPGRASRRGLYWVQLLVAPSRGGAT